MKGYEIVACELEVVSKDLILHLVEKVGLSIAEITVLEVSTDTDLANFVGVFCFTGRVFRRTYLAGLVRVDEVLGNRVDKHIILVFKRNDRRHRPVKLNCLLNSFTHFFILAFDFFLEVQLLYETLSLNRILFFGRALGLLFSRIRTEKIGGGCGGYALEPDLRKRFQSLLKRVMERQHRVLSLIRVSLLLGVLAASGQLLIMIFFFSIFVRRHTGQEF